METNPSVISNFPTGSNGTSDGAINKASASAHGAVDKVTASADGAASALKPAIARAANVAHQAVDKVTGLAAPTADWLTKQRENLTLTGRNAVDDARTYVSTHPWQSLAVALAAGYVIGRRRSH